MQSITLVPWVFGFAVDVDGWPGFTYDFLRLAYRSESIFHPQSRSDAKMISFYGAQAAFQTYRSAVQRLSALTHRGPNYLCF